MKSKNISFAEVLKKNSKSPRMDFTAKNSSLFSLFEEYESNPDQDYTLYLAQTNHSQRGKLKSFQMHQSKFTNQQQQELFDSWIQKQSFMTSNKQNIRTQSKRFPANEQVKKSEGYKRIQPSTRSKGDFYLSNHTNSKEMERSSKAEETYQEKFTPLHIEMIKSKGYEPNQNLQRATSPKSKFNSQKTIASNSQAIVNRGGNKANEQRLIPQNNKKSMKQIEKQPEQVFQKPKVEAQSFKSFTKINESVQSLKIQEDISNITKKYMDQKYLDQDQDELEDEQLLLQNSNFPFSRKQSEKTQTLPQKKEPNFDKSEEINKKRIEQAKNLIGDYFNYIKKAKRVDQHNEANDFRPNKFDYRSGQNNNHEGVGYSFSTTFQQQDRKQDKIEAIKPIQQLQHENPNESLNDSDFRLKYLNLRSSEAAEENEYIQNIQSVRYDDFSHRDNQINAPYDSFKVKLILSNDKQKHEYKNNQYYISAHQIQQKTENLVKQKDSLQLKKSLESVANKPLGKSRQKISLISSNKSKASSSKASPKMPINSEKQSEIITTDFNMQTNLLQKKSIQNKIYSNQYLGTKQDEKKLQIEQKSIYQINKEELLPNNPPQEPQKPKQQLKQSLSKQQISTVDQTSSLNTYAYSKPAYSGYSTYITSAALPSNASTYVSPPTSTYTCPTPTTPTYATSTPSVNIPTSLKTSNFNSSIERNYYTTTNEPTYGNTTKNQILGARVYAYSPMKTQNSYTQEYIKEQIKKQNHPHLIKQIVPISSNSYEQKYALPESTSDKEKSLGKNYLSKLEIKESITLVESKTEKQVEYKHNIHVGSSKTSYMNTFGKDHIYSNPIFSNNGLGSLKQSINVSEGDQFTFDL